VTRDEFNAKMGITPPKTGSGEKPNTPKGDEKSKQTAQNKNESAQVNPS
jgi:hypothetical protein